MSLFLVTKSFAYEFVADTVGVKCLDAAGNLCKGWINQGGFIFWFDANGYMVIGEHKLAQQDYLFNDGSAAYAPIGALISDGFIVNEKQSNNIRYAEGYNTRFDNGRIIMLIHGLTGNIEDTMTLAKYYMIYGYKVIVPELIAHGNSLEVANVPQIIARSTVALESIINSYIDEEHPTIDICGTSLGGMIGTCIVKDLKGKISRLALLISTYDFSELNDEIFFNTYYQGRVEEKLEKTSIMQLFRSINPNNDPDLFKYTKVYLVQSSTDNIIPYITTPRSGVEFHTSPASGHNLRDVDYFDSFKFLLAGAKKYVPTKEEKEKFNFVKIDGVQNSTLTAAVIISQIGNSTTNTLGVTGETTAVTQIAETTNEVIESFPVTLGPGLKENGEALTQEEVELIQDSMEATGEYTTAKAILAN